MEEFFKSVRDDAKRWTPPPSEKPDVLRLLAAISGQEPDALASRFEPLAADFERLFCGLWPALKAVREQGHTTIAVVETVDAADIDAMARGFIDIGCPDLAAALLLAGATCPQMATERQAAFVSQFLGIEGNSLGQRVAVRDRHRLAGHAAFLSKFEDIELDTQHPWKQFFDSIDPVELEAAHREGHRRAFVELLSQLVAAYEDNTLPLTPEELIKLLKRFRDEATKSRIEQSQVDVLRAVQRVMRVNRKQFEGKDLPALKATFRGIEDAAKRMRGYQLLLGAGTASMADVKNILAATPLPGDFEFDINLRGIDGRTALELAMRKGKADIAERLIEQPGIDPNVVGPGGYTLLQTCVYKGRKRFVRLLLAHPDIDVNARTPGGRDSALHMAIRNEDVAIVELLLAHPRVDVNLRAIGTPLDCALEQDNDTIIRMLKDRQAVASDNSLPADLS